MTRLALAALLVAVAAPARAVFNDVGGSTLQYLRLGPSGRALGMGEAYGPVATGADAVYWNPAGLVETTRLETLYSHSDMLGLFRLDHVSVALPVPRLWGSVGLSGTFFTQEKLPLVTNTNTNIGSFSPHGEAVSLAYARRFFSGEDHPTRDRGYFQDLWKRAGADEPLDHEPEPWTGMVGVGAAVKFVSETIYDESAWAVALDAGARYHPLDLEELALTAVLRNLGTSPKFRNESESLPLEGSLGASYLLALDGQRVIPAFEVAVPAEGKPYGKLGVEYSFPVSEHWRLALRGGYKSLAAYDLGPLAGLAGGMGIEGKALTVDFAFQPMAALGEVYRGSLGWKFNPPEPARRRPARRVSAPAGRRAAPVKGVEVVPVDPRPSGRPRY